MATLDVGQYVTVPLPRYPKYTSDTWVITCKYQVNGVWRFDLENVTKKRTPFTEMGGLFEKDLQAASLQLELDTPASPEK